MAYNREVAEVAPYSVGNRVYGGGRSFPTAGAVDRSGYRERDLTHRARRDAVNRKLKAIQSGKYASADAQRKV